MAGDDQYTAQEPSAVARQAARTMRDQFLALVKEGFTEPQAIQIIGTMLSAAIMKKEE